MPATTKNLKIPYPTGGDPVRDGPQTFQEAMQLIDEMLTALTVTKLPTPPLTDGIRKGNAGFEIYRQGNLIIFQGALVCSKNIPNGNFFAQPLPPEIRPATEIWCASNQYGTARNVILYPDGTLKVASGTNGDRTIYNYSFYELGALKYVIEPAQESTTNTQGVTQ